MISKYTPGDLYTDFEYPEGICSGYFNTEEEWAVLSGLEGISDEELSRRMAEDMKGFLEEFSYNGSPNLKPVKLLMYLGEDKFLAQLKYEHGDPLKFEARRNDYEDWVPTVKLYGFIEAHFESYRDFDYSMERALDFFISSMRSKLV